MNAETFLDSIPDATPAQYDKARDTLARWTLNGDVDKDTARVVASALNLLGDNVTHLAPTDRRRARIHPRTVAIRGGR